MKKLSVALAVLLAAGFAFAYTWNINWSLDQGWAYSPDDPDKGVLDDYNVTWSLMNADTGLALAEMYAAKGTTIGFDDSANGGGSTTFSSYLDTPTGSTLYLGSASTNTPANIYQYIYIDNGTVAYEWQSDTKSIKPADVHQGIPESWGFTVIGPDGADEVNASWTPTALKTIPEPATMSLLGLGALAMALRRKIRK